MAIAGGLFVSLEGGEGSGKSVQAATLVARLAGRGLEVVATREPGGTPVGERVRDILLFAREVPLEPSAQAFLFATARAQLVHEVIRPALERGAVVVADRFFDSTLAYQGHGWGLDVEMLRAVTRLAVGDVVPDLTLLLDVPVEISLGRGRARSDRWDRFETVDAAFHRRVREGYLSLARAEPGRFAVIAADRDEATVARDVAARVEERLAARMAADR